MDFGLCKICSVAIIFLIANIFVMFTSINKKQDFYNILDNKLIEKYEKIVIERRNIYYVGFFIGIILSILLLVFLKYKKINISKISAVCIVGFVTFLFNYIYYILYPKTDYMILHLEHKKQREEWLKLNNDMKNRTHLGFGLGIISVMLFSFIYKN